MLLFNLVLTNTLDNTLSGLIFPGGHVRQQREANFRSVPKTQNYCEPEENTTEVEYVGHLVSHKGVSFERPRTHKEMLMYVGLVNYFHDHVRNFSGLLDKWWNDTISTNA